MKRETSIFSPDLIIEISGEDTPIDTSHIYSGEIFGKSSCFQTPHILGGSTVSSKEMSLIQLWCFYFSIKLKVCILICQCSIPTLSFISSLEWLVKHFNWGTMFSSAALWNIVWENHLKVVFVQYLSYHKPSHTGNTFIFHPVFPFRS